MSVSVFVPGDLAALIAATKWDLDKPIPAYMVPVIISIWDRGSSDEVFITRTAKEIRCARVYGMYSDEIYEFSVVHNLEEGTFDVRDDVQVLEEETQAVLLEPMEDRKMTFELRDTTKQLYDTLGLPEISLLDLDALVAFVELADFDGVMCERRPFKVYPCEDGLVEARCGTYRTVLLRDPAGHLKVDQLD